MPGLAVQLVKAKVDIIVTAGTESAVAARRLGHASSSVLERRAQPPGVTDSAEAGA
jgi:hypothetical protein